MRLARIFLAVGILRVANSVSRWLVPELNNPAPVQPLRPRYPPNFLGWTGRGTGKIQIPPNQLNNL